MNAARMVGTEAWCSRAGCRATTPIATVGSYEDGTTNARLLSSQWRRDGFLDDIPRYIETKRKGRTIKTSPSGIVNRLRHTRTRVPCPVVVVCPSCGWVQAIGLTPPTP